MAIEKKEWQKFRVGKLSKNPNFVNTSCKPLLTISHVTHLNDALNIFQAGKINAGLVSDESLLNKDRTLVVWLSPNDWNGAGGSRYGNVSFNFDWKKLINSKNFYWVESIAYSIPAPRILVTDKHYSRFSKYDPTTGDGPWWYREEDGIHYWNGKIALEIVIERDIYLNEMKSFDFVKHSQNKCSIDPVNCPDLGLSQFHAGPRFICALTGPDNDNVYKFFKSHQTETQVDILKYNVRLLWMYMITEGNIKFSGNIVSTDKIALPLARAILNSYAYERFDELGLLASLFKSPNSLKKSCAKLIGECISLEWEELL